MPDYAVYSNITWVLFWYHAVLAVGGPDVALLLFSAPGQAGFKS